MLAACSISSSALRIALNPQYLRFPLKNPSVTFLSKIAQYTTVSEVITADHRDLENSYNEIVNSADIDHQQRFGNQFTWELARHSIAEELVVYPAFEKYMGKEGHEMAEKDRKEHHDVKLFLKTFQDMSPKDSDYVPKLEELMSNLSQHIKEEVQDDLPRLEKALKESDQSISESLAKSFGRTKAFVPSRSHPSAGEKPPFETVMGLLTAPMDHIADIFRKFPEGTISPNPSKK